MELRAIAKQTEKNYPIKLGSPSGLLRYLLNHNDQKCINIRS